MSTWLFVDLAQNFGGHEVMILRWIEELARAGAAKPVLMCASGTRLASMARAICPVTEVDIGAPAPRSRWRAALQMLRVLRVMAAAIWRWRPRAVVVGEGCLMAQRHGLLAAFVLRQYVVLYVPLVATFDEMGFSDAARLERRMKRFYGKLPSAWLTITEDQAAEFREWSKVKQPIYCLPNTVSSAVEARQGDRIQRDGYAPAARTKVLVLGRLESRQKGLDLLLEYLIGNPGLGEQFEVHFVGEGPFSDELSAAITAHPHLAGYLTTTPWRDAIEVLCLHDVLLLPSRYEGVPLVMLEAMAIGLPVVASDLPGTRPYLPGNCLFPVGDLRGAFERLRGLRESPAHWREVAAENMRAFRAQASGAAFNAAVLRLTGLVNAGR